MAADGQCLNQGELFQAKSRTGVELVGRYDQPGAQSPIRVDPHHLQVLTAVAPAALAGMAMAAIEIGLHGAMITRGDMRHTRPSGQHLHPQLVAGNARVAEKRHFAQIAGIVAAANAYPTHAYQRHAGVR